MLNEVKRIYNLLPNKSQFWLLCLCGAASSFLSVVPLAILGDVVDRVVATGGPANGLNGIIDLVGASLLLFTVVSVLAVVTRNVFGTLSTNYGINVVNFYRKKVFVRLCADWTNGYFDMPVGDKIKRVTGDTANLTRGISYPLTTFGSDLLDVLWISVLLLLVSPFVLLSAWLLVPIIFLAAWRGSKSQSAINRQIVEIEAQLTEKVQKVFNNRKTILSLSGEEREVAEFSIKSDRNSERQFHLSWEIGKLFVLEGLGRQVGFSCVVVSTIALLAVRAVTVGEMVMVVGLASRFFTPIGSIARFMPVLRNVSVSIDRIEQVLGRHSASLAGSGFQTKQASLERLTFNDPVVELPGGTRIALSLTGTVSVGELAVLQGKSGVGKSSLLSALQGVESTLVQGATFSPSVSEFDRRTICQYVSATQGLLTDDVFSEVAYPRRVEDVGKDRIKLLLEQFGLEHLAARVSDRLLVSDGERVRIILARSMLSPSQLLLIDEPFINLDGVSVAQVEEALLTIAGTGRTVLVATHTVTSDFALKGFQVLNVSTGNDGSSPT